MKRAGGRPPLPPTEAKSELFAFRLTPIEKEWVDAIGDSFYWRDVVVDLAKLFFELEDDPNPVIREMASANIEIAVKEYVDRLRRENEVED